MCDFLSSYQRVICRFVVVIPLAILLCGVGVVIAQPRSIEGGLVFDEGAKRFDCGLQSAEPRLQKVSDVVRPRIRDRVDGAKLGHDGSTESDAGLRDAVSSVDSSREIGCKTSQSKADNKSTNVFGDEGRDQLLFLVVVLVPLWPLLFQIFQATAAKTNTHNVRANRRAAV